MSRILICVENRENRRLLAEWLSQHHEISFIEMSTEGVPGFDCAIFDGVALARSAATILGWKKASEPFFLPVLLMTSRHDVRMITRQLWRTVDELIFMPIEKVELLLRAQVLLRARSLSLQLGQMNTQLRHQIAEREQAEAELSQSLDSTRELYDLSHQMVQAKTIDEVLRIITSIGVLHLIQDAALIGFDPPWQDNPPERFEVWSHLSPQSEQGVPDKLAGDWLRNLPSLRTTPMYIPDLANPDVPEALHAALSGFGAGSLLALALVAGSVWYGVFLLYSPVVDAWTGDDVLHIQQVIEQAALTLDNIRLLQAEITARQQAERADNSKMQFLAVVLHELRNPLLSIKGFATTLLADDVTWQPEQVQEFLSIIDQEADKINDMTEQLLDLSRLEAGHLRIVPEPCHWSDILKIGMAQLFALTPNHRLDIDQPDHLPRALADAQRIAQVITNLVRNAVQHSPPGTLIHLTAFPQDDSLQIDIRDQGSGIPPDKRTLVFQPFQQAIDADEQRRHKGLGMGLAICRAIVQAHGGRIWISEAPTPGTTVSFTLPLAP